MATSHMDPNLNEAVSSGHIIYSEILSVTSVMRKNSRWSSTMQTFYTRDSALASNLGLRRPGPNNVSTPQQGNREEDLMSGFEELKRTLRSTQGMCNVSNVRDFGDVLFYSKISPLYLSLIFSHPSFPSFALLCLLGPSRRLPFPLYIPSSPAVSF